MSNALKLETTAPGYCCPYCLKPVGYFGRAIAVVLGTRFHGCDFSNVKHSIVTDSGTDRQAGLFERAVAAETALKRANKHIEELQAKVKATDCACSHDEPGDVCVAHSPVVSQLRDALRAMHRRAQAAESVAECAEGYLSLWLDVLMPDKRKRERWLVRYILMDIQRRVAKRAAALTPQDRETAE